MTNKKTYISNHIDQDLEVELPKKKKRKTKKKKRRVPRTTEYDENMDNHIYDEPAISTPRALPPDDTTSPKSLKPLPKRLRTPSEASFGTNSTNLRSRTDPSSSGVYSEHDYRKPRKQKEHTINIDSDNEDRR